MFIFGCLGNVHILIVRELEMTWIPKKKGEVGLLAKYVIYCQLPYSEGALQRVLLFMAKCVINMTKYPCVGVCTVCYVCLFVKRRH